MLAPSRNSGVDPISEALLTLDDVTVQAGGRTLVHHLSFALKPGQQLALVGPNGSGKTTLLRALAGLAPIHAGQIQRPTTPPGMLFQQGGLWAHMTVEQHLAFVDVQADLAWRQRLLEQFRLEHLRDRRPEALSGGEQVRLALARSLAGRPSWVLLDEPLAHLDPAVRAEVRASLPVALEELGAAAIIVTHHAEDILLFAPTLLCLHGDGGWWTGPSRSALESPPHAALAAFSERGSLLQARADDDGRVHYGLGLELDQQAPGALVAAFLDAAAVHVGLPDEDQNGNGQFVASDLHGGCWIRSGTLLLRSTASRSELDPGQAVTVTVTGQPRALNGTGSS